MRKLKHDQKQEPKSQIWTEKAYMEHSFMNTNMNIKAHMNPVLRTQTWTQRPHKHAGFHRTQITKAQMNTATNKKVPINHIKGTADLFLWSTIQRVATEFTTVPFKSLSEQKIKNILVFLLEKGSFPMYFL